MLKPYSHSRLSIQHLLNPTYFNKCKNEVRLVQMVHDRKESRFNNIRQKEHDLIVPKVVVLVVHKVYLPYKWKFHGEPTDEICIWRYHIEYHR